jgi:hypothetical protein
MGKRASTYFIIGTLSPDADCLAFNPGELKLGRGWVLDICYTLVSLWNPRLRRPFHVLKPLVREYLRLLADLYSFHANRLLSFKLVHWVEAREVIAKKNMIGVFKGSDSIRITANRNNEQNRRWRKVARIFAYVLSQQHLRLAVKDHVNAMREEGYDSAFFAYRSVEHVCRSITGAVGQLSSSDWAKMHQALGTSKSMIEPLTKAATQVRHGNISSTKQVERMVKRREELLGISRGVLARRFRYTHGWFVALPK